MNYESLYNKYIYNKYIYDKCINDKYINDKYILINLLKELYFNNYKKFKDTSAYIKKINSLYKKIISNNFRKKYKFLYHKCEDLLKHNSDEKYYKFFIRSIVIIKYYTGDLCILEEYINKYITYVLNNYNNYSIYNYLYKKNYLYKLVNEIDIIYDEKYFVIFKDTYFEDLSNACYKLIKKLYKNPRTGFKVFTNLIRNNLIIKGNKDDVSSLINNNINNLYEIICIDDNTIKVYHDFENLYNFKNPILSKYINLYNMLLALVHIYDFKKTIHSTKLIDICNSFIVLIKHQKDFINNYKSITDKLIYLYYPDKEFNNIIKTFLKHIYSDITGLELFINNYKYSTKLINICDKYLNKINITININDKSFLYKKEKKYYYLFLQIKSIRDYEYLHTKELISNFNNYLKIIDRENIRCDSPILNKKNLLLELDTTFEHSDMIKYINIMKRFEIYNIDETQVAKKYIKKLSNFIDCFIKLLENELYDIENTYKIVLFYTNRLDIFLFMNKLVDYLILNIVKVYKILNTKFTNFIDCCIELYDDIKWNKYISTIIII